MLRLDLADNPHFPLAAQGVALHAHFGAEWENTPGDGTGASRPLQSRARRPVIGDEDPRPDKGACVLTAPYFGGTLPHLEHNFPSSTAHVTTSETPSLEKPPPSRLRRVLSNIKAAAASRIFLNILKAAATFGAFYLLFTHGVKKEDGTEVSALRQILDYIPHIDARTFWIFVSVSAGVKALGILSSMTRWHVLLIAQGIRFPFRHIVGSFLIGRFLGTFLPSTLGLDGYKLYDAARFSKRTVEAAAATVIEKVLGFVGIFLTFLVALPFGGSLFEPYTGRIAALTIPFSLAVVGAFFLIMTNPRPIQRFIEAIPLPGAGRDKLQAFVRRTTSAAAAFRHRGGTLFLAAVLSFLVHFTTAAMYFFTALAIGAAHADFWQVTLASSVQILATVLSPFTIAGEGVREIVQAALLKHKLGVTEAILSAALGFWSAEALTLLGGIIWWARGSDYKPRYCVLEKTPAPD